jgi:hypothetical protein
LADKPKSLTFAPLSQESKFFERFSSRKLSEDIGLLNDKDSQ